MREGLRKASVRVFNTMQYETNQFCDTDDGFNDFLFLLLDDCIDIEQTWITVCLDPGVVAADGMVWYSIMKLINGLNFLN